MKKIRKTNTGLVTNLMDYSAQGALMQAFILEAIGRYAKEVAASTFADYPSMSYVNPAAWIACGKEAKETLDKHFES